MTYFPDLDGMYWRNGQRPRNDKSCSSTVRFGPGTNASKRDLFQISNTFPTSENLSGDLQDRQAAASSNRRTRNMS